MPPIEIGPAGPGKPRLVAGIRAAQAADEAKPKGAAQQEAVQSLTPAGQALDPSEAPIDTDRVAQIKKAIEDGKYPVIPFRIADAMIAAGLLLRSGK